MVPHEPPRRPRFADRTLIAAAAILWAVAVILAGFYAWDATAASTASPDDRSAIITQPAATSGPTGPGPVDASTPAADTTSTTAPPTTTTTPPDPTTTTTSTSTTLPPPPPPLTIAAGGDVLGDRGVGLFIDKHGGDAVLAEVKPFLEEAHLAFVNLECPISDVGTRAMWKEYTFRGRTALAQGLASAGVDVVSMANNHTLDYGTSALIDALERLDDAGVAYAGAGADAASAGAPTLLITPAGTVAVLAYTGILPSGFAAGKERPGVNPVTSDPSPIVEAVAAAAEKVDFVVVSFHWGVEYTGQANSGQRSLAHQVIDAGADLVLGHHPHVIQGLELYKDRLIAYSLGDFVFDHYSRQTGEAFVLQVDLQHEGPPSLRVIPVYLNDTTGVPAPVSEAAADVILQRLARLSSDLGLDLVVSGDRATYNTDGEVIP